jgi:hypothetical protein
MQYTNVNTAEIVTRDSVVGKNRPDYRGVVIRFQTGTKYYYFYIISFQTGSRAHPVLYSSGIVVANRLSESKVKVKNEWSYTSTPCIRLLRKKITRSSHKIRFPILLPPNNLTQ